MKKFWFTGLMAALALLQATSLRAISFQSSDIRIGDGTSSNSGGDFQLLSSGTGSIYAAWLDYRDSGDYNNSNVYFNRSTDYGKTWQSADVRLSTCTSYELQMACAGDRVYLSWTEDRWPDPNRQDVMFRYSHANGVSWSGITALSDDLLNYQKKCKLAAPGGGKVYAFWKDFNDHYGMNFQRSLDGGATWGATFTIDSNYKDYPVLHADSSGHVYAGYADRELAYGRFIVRASSDYGFSWGPSRRLDGAYTAGWTAYHSLGSSGEKVYAVWQEHTGSYNYRFNRSTDCGSSWNPSGTVLNSDTSGYKNSDYGLAYDDGGNVYVAWVQSDVSGSNNVHVNVSNDSGASWLGTDISLTSYTSSDVRIASSPGDEVVVAYEDRASWMVGTDVTSVLKARYSSDGGQNWDAEVCASSQTSPEAGQKLVAATADSYYFYLLWRQYDSGLGGVAMYLNYAELIPGPTPLPLSGVTPGDYSGDGTAQIGIYRPTTGLWAVNGETNTYFGSGTDRAIPRDYDGDGSWDIGIFRSSQNLWAIKDHTRIYFGGTGDNLIPGDYNADGTADMGVFKEARSLWAIRGVTRVYYGNSATDYLVPGDYDGDGGREMAVFRETNGLWAIRGNPSSSCYFGSSGDLPIQGDYDGDGTWDIGVFRLSSNLWAIRGVTRVYYGNAITDEPVPTDYDGDGSWDIGIFRPTTGLWAIRNVGNSYFGTVGDQQVTSIPLPNP